jgi:hypothetical protein
MTHARRMIETSPSDPAVEAEALVLFWFERRNTDF